MKKQYTALILDEAATYIGTMSDADQGTTKADIEAMEQGEFETVKTKQLRGKIRELIVGKHRLTYFVLEKFIYFVRGFTKKTNKTPPREITYAEQIFKLVQDQEK
jgi:phage-related protein